MTHQNSLKNLQRTITNINKWDEHELFILKKRLDQVILLVIIPAILLLVLRLWFLQVYKGYDYDSQSRDNRIRKLRIVAPRGNLLDRDGKILVANRPSFNVVWTKEDAPDPEQVIKRLARILDVDIASLWNQIRTGSHLPQYMPLRLREDIDWEKLVYIENNHLRLPGVRIEALPTRSYNYGSLASHLIGYLGEISKTELERATRGDYQGGDQIGKLGVEKLMEDQLRGELGQTILEVDARGFEKKKVAVQEALPGQDIYLTIDADLQKAAEKAMAGKSGAVVAQEVNSGRILALVSSPELPLESFVGGISQQDWRKLLDNPLQPLLNKAIQGQYPPASTYKIITALAGLEQGVITPETTVHCSGSINFGNRRYHCWKKHGHGDISLKRALAESCDVYFYLLSQKIDVDILARYARSFGLGSRTGIKLAHEKKGLVPSSAWKLRTYREPWQAGETLSVSIGQGFNLATPLQINQMTAALANGGKVFKPQFIEKTVNPEGKILEVFTPLINHETDLEPRNLALITEGLVAAVNAPHGTGSKARLKTVTVAGKTGTAQVVRRSQNRELKEQDIPYQHRDHAWFTCFAPAEKPEIAVTVLVEHGIHGGSAAAPVARAVLAGYFNLEEPVEPAPASDSSGD